MAERTGAQRWQEQFASLTYIGRTVTEQKWKEAKHWFRTQNDRCTPLKTTHYYQALESQCHDTAAMERAAWVFRPYFQIKSGHAIMSTYLQRIGRAVTNLC